MIAYFSTVYIANVSCCNSCHQCSYSLRHSSRMHITWWWQCLYKLILCLYLHSQPQVTKLICHAYICKTINSPFHLTETPTKHIRGHSCINVENKLVINHKLNEHVTYTHNVTHPSNQYLADYVQYLRSGGVRPGIKHK